MFQMTGLFLYITYFISNASNNVQSQKIYRFTQSSSAFHKVTCRYFSDKEASKDA